MTLIQVTDDLVIEVWPGGEADEPLLKVRSLSQGVDGETPPGVLIVYAEEIGPLVEALFQAMTLLSG